MTDERIYQIGLTMIPGVGHVLARHLLETVGSAEGVFCEDPQVLEKVPGLTRQIAAAVRRPEVLARAEKERAFIEKNGIDLFFFTDPDYPYRLRDCSDAPLLFYRKGKADLNAQRVISIVGTRQATAYGRECTEQIVKDLAASFPGLLVVSGLAYGIDICAHRAALDRKLPTVGVLAHGLDRIYPPAHRETAREMLAEGGLVTDFPSETFPDRPLFLQRNRIIAGLADATLVIESADHGGSLVTADLAFSYGRDVFAVPGRLGDPHSRGCNRLIRQNKAGLLSSAADLIESMNWRRPTSAAPLPQQALLLFPDSDHTEQILSLLRTHKELHVNRLSLLLDMPVRQLSPLLFELEMNGLVHALPGNVYRVTE